MVFKQLVTLRSHVIAIGLAAISVLIFDRASFGQDTKVFEMLIVGDSHISGQGLREKDKFYSLVRDWLRDSVFVSRKVDLKVKAHAGSRISMHPEELEEMRRSGDDIYKFHYAEANVSSPTL